MPSENMRRRMAAAEATRARADAEVTPPVKGNDLTPRVRKDPPNDPDIVGPVVQLRPPWDMYECAIFEQEGF